MKTKLNYHVSLVFEKNLINKFDNCKIMKCDKCDTKQKAKTLLPHYKASIYFVNKLQQKYEIPSNILIDFWQ